MMLVSRLAFAGALLVRGRCHACIMYMCVYMCVCMYMCMHTLACPTTFLARSNTVMFGLLDDATGHVTRASRTSQVAHTQALAPLTS